MKDLWPQLETLIGSVEHPVRYINHEYGCTRKPDAGFHFCMVYPDTYELGQANQALRILVNAVNACEDMEAQRAFLPAPDMCDMLRSKKIPLCSVEGCAPLAEFDVVGITLPHELAATNVLETLDLAGIALHADARGEDDPFVVAGGPCTFNPEPYAAFFDFFSIGEGEEALPEALGLIYRLRAAHTPRKDILRELAQKEGIYVPSLYEWQDEAHAQAAGSWIEPCEAGLPCRINKRLFDGFAESCGWEPCIVPFAEVVHDRLNVEILRGCSRGCRFCQAGMMYRPVRERTADNVVESAIAGLAQTGYDEVSLTSLSSTDHSQIAEILARLNQACAGRGVRISIPSQRLDSFGVDMAKLVAGQKKGGLTFAPEAGTQRLRDVINKNVTEQDLLSALDGAITAGWRRCKLYFMIGLPTETDEDIQGIARLAECAYRHMKAAAPPEQRGSLRLSISCALFIPKAQTPFQWDGQITPEEAKRRVNLLRGAIKSRAIDVHWHDPASSFIEAVISRAGRECASWIEAAWRRGARFDAWSEYFNEQAWREAEKTLDFSLTAVAQTSYPSDYVMPWAHISTGVSTQFLARERKRAQQGRTTPDCTFGECSGCGVCTLFDTDITLAHARVKSVPEEQKAATRANR